MSKYKQFSELLTIIKKYPTPSDLVYKHKFTHDDVKDIYNQKYNDDRYIKLPLYNEDGTSVIFLNSDYYINKLNDSEELILSSNIDELSDIEDEDLIKGFVFSEIESSLAIEGVRITRAKIEKINNLKYSEMKTKNEIIVKNMLEAYSYVRENNITKENILNLYNLISNECLEDVEKLKDNNFYRHDTVNIIGGNEKIVDKGVSFLKLEKMMDDLLIYIHKDKSIEEQLLTPHVIHYYLIYLHPYFDYNGRMARVLSYWYTIKYVPSFSLLFISEAINTKKNKKRYYDSIIFSRRTNNDMTYFIEYISDIILEYSILYINYYSIMATLKGNGNVLSRSFQIALKNVLSIPKVGDGYFDWKSYHNFTSDNFSKVYFLNLLNGLVDLKILTVKKQKNVKLYKLNSKKWDLIFSE